MSLMREAAIGVDIGGGSVKLGLVRRSGRLLVRQILPTADYKSRRALLTALEDVITGLTREARRRGLKVAGVGIGAPGPIDVKRGFIYFFPNIPGWRNTPLKKILESRLRFPVYVDNDANVMALGEQRYGAGRGVKNVVALTLGTGIGGGIVIDGRLFHGPHFSAAEIGHITVNEDGPVCGCGSRGCIETYVGSGYFIREVLRRLRSGKKSLLNGWLKAGRVLTPRLVEDAARKGDAFSIRFWHETGTHLGTALAGLANVLNPERILLGGGIAKSGTLLFGPTVAALKKKAFPIAAASVKVMPAALGVDAGIIGAAALAWDES